MAHSHCMLYKWGYRQHSEYVMLTAFRRQKWLRERTSTLDYTNIAYPNIHQWQKICWAAKVVNLHSELWSGRCPLLQCVTALWGFEITYFCFTVSGTKIDWFELKGRRDIKFVADCLLVCFYLFSILSCLLNTVTVLQQIVRLHHSKALPFLHRTAISPRSPPNAPHSTLLCLHYSAAHFKNFYSTGL